MNIAFNWFPSTGTSLNRFSTVPAVFTFSQAVEVPSTNVLPFFESRDFVLVVCKHARSRALGCLKYIHFSAGTKPERGLKVSLIIDILVRQIAIVMDPSTPVDVDQSSASICIYCSLVNWPQDKPNDWTAYRYTMIPLFLVCSMIIIRLQTRRPQFRSTPPGLKPRLLFVTLVGSLRCLPVDSACTLDRKFWLARPLSPVFRPIQIVTFSWFVI